MKRYIVKIAAVALGVFALSAALHGVHLAAGDSRVQAHVYKDPGTSIAKVRLKAFYVVPANRTDSIYFSWRDILQSALASIKEFHKVQFRGLSDLTYDIFPDPVVLSKTNDVYDTSSTNEGNPKALQSIDQEISSRVFSQGGDLWRPGFSEAHGDEYAVRAYLYEGVGASGALHALILSRQFLSDKEYELFGATLFAHEFGHTLGLPDEYDLATNVPFDDDLMGGGRRQPISIIYIERSLLADMGVMQSP